MNHTFVTAGCSGKDHLDCNTYSIERTGVGGFSTSASLMKVMPRENMIRVAYFRGRLSGVEDVVFA